MDLVRLFRLELPVKAKEDRRNRLLQVSMYQHIGKGQERDTQQGKRETRESGAKREKGSVRERESK